MRNPLIFAAAAVALAMPASAALAPGAAAPMFTAAGARAGQPVRVDLRALLRRGPVVLYFFPAAFTPGCNAEAAAFAAAIDDYRAAGATVVGMTAGNVDQLKEFSSRHCAGKFPVAAATPEIVRGYDVALGRQINGADVTNRTSYVIGRDGRIVFAHSDLNPADHVRTTLAAARGLRR